MADIPRPCRHSFSCPRRSSPSLVSRRISATTSSRKSSTSRSSYPRRNWVWVKVLFRTSSGESAMCPPQRARSVRRSSIPDRRGFGTTLDDLQEDRDQEHEDQE